MIFKLGFSKIHGIGVFATEDIKAGSFLPLFEDDDSIFITEKKAKTNKIQYRMIKNHGVWDEDKKGYFIPKNFNRMSIGWYLNHSKNPNAYNDKNYNYFSLKAIRKWEEITIDYSLL